MTEPKVTWAHALGALGFLLLIVGSAMGLFMAPPERHMGEVSRILYVHLPAAWNALLFFTFAFIAAIVSLWTASDRWDARLTGLLETGVVLNGLLLATGMIFARPTWGVWWSWDVRLTTSLISFVLFAGILGLRGFVDESRRRAAWSAVATIVAYVDVPLIYFCVRWWRSLHQVQSSPETIDAGMVTPVRINAFAVLFLGLWFVAMRAQVERRRLAAEQVAPPKRLETASAPLGG
jgi:heme exporter protein C